MKNKLGLMIKRIESKFKLFFKQKPPKYFVFIFLYSFLVQFIFSVSNPFIYKFSKNYKKRISKGSFTNQWFDSNISLFNLVLFLSKILLYFRFSKELNALELGSWEGRSSLFISSRYKKINLTCVDTWKGADEHQDNPEVKNIYLKFKNNVSLEINKKIYPKKLKSKDFFNNLEKQVKYHFIYVDASHKFNDAYLDLANSINHAAKFSFIILDDYLWNFYNDSSLGPGFGFNLFLKGFRGKMILPIFISYQVVLLVI